MKLQRSPHFLLASLSLSCLMAATTSAVAQILSVSITNSSFENPVLTGGDGSSVLYGAGTAAAPVGFGKITQASSGGFADPGIEDPNGGNYTGAAGRGTPLGADGPQVLFLNNSTFGNKTAVFQSVGVLQANTTYRFTVAIGARLDRTNESGFFSLINTATGSGTSTDAGTVLATGSGISNVPGSFQDFSVTYTTGATVSGDLTIEVYTIENGAIQASFDNLRLTATAVPEPSALALCAAGSLAFAGWLRRRR